MARTKIMQKAIPTDLFSYHAADKLFTSEISTLRGYDFCSRVSLVNPKTHVVVDFEIDVIDRDRDGDVAGWRFKSANRRYPDLRVLIIND